MASIKRVVLDVLKPHHPNALEFSRIIADVGSDYQIHVMVIEVDEKTETLQVIVEGEAVDFDALQIAITNLGGSVHSIDEVNVHSEPSLG
jgi:hypothetical protein